MSAAPPASNPRVDRTPMKWLRHTWQSDKRRFLIVGAWNTVFGYLAFAATHLLSGEAWHPTATVVVAYCIALPQSFLTQRLLVFQRTQDDWRKQFLRFLGSNSAIFAANLILLPLFVAATRTSPLFGQALFVAGSTVASYLVHKHYSFAD
ncbi:MULTISPECIES: GtrA family protein [Lysobacter]|uniref:GtrA family protein n=1 Tax=Lysobacter TaxID=68 RepID=UPI001F4719B1|nr:MULTISPECIES: GtrA family protein [Lysobacter]UJB20131.1 GtrA family protein [Lysobacter capsici]UJQ30754.1 GtrA family protein [Lysobacter gummosus]